MRLFAETSDVFCSELDWEEIRIECEISKHRFLSFKESYRVKESYMIQSSIAKCVAKQKGG